MPALLLAALLLICSTCASPIRETKAPHPNIVLVMSDDQGWGDAGFRGHERLETPHLDEMAREGVVFERFYAAAPVCSPTRGSVLTGRHPMRYGITNANVGHLPSEEHTLAELLRAEGYATGHFGKWHLGTLTTSIPDSNRGGPTESEHYAPPWEHGFEVCFSTEAKVPTHDPMVTPEPAHGGVGGKTPGEPYGTAYWTGPDERVLEGLDGDDSRLIVEHALAFIDVAVREQRPFLAVVWLHAPHLPVVASEEDCAAFADLPLKERHYLGCLTAVDRELGRLRTHLRQLGVERNTMLWYCSDNGPEGGPNSGLGSTSGLRGRKRSLYEGGVRVPGLLEWPGLEVPARSVAAPAGTVDYLPTILAALELAPPEVELDGVDLLPLIRGETTARAAGMGFVHGAREAWIEERWKLIRKGDSPYELYDLLLDREEAHDLAAEHPERVAELRRRLASWRGSL